MEDAARPAAQNPSGAAVDHNRDLSTFGVGRWLNWKSSTFSTGFGDPENLRKPRLCWPNGSRGWAPSGHGIAGGTRNGWQ